MSATESESTPPNRPVDPPGTAEYYVLRFLVALFGVGAGFIVAYIIGIAMGWIYLGFC